MPHRQGEKTLKKALRKVAIKGNQAAGETESSKFIKVINENIETPISKLHFSAITRPCYFPGSPIPRYKVALIIDKESDEGSEFFKMLEEHAKEEEVSSLGKKTDSGILMTFQGKNPLKVFMCNSTDKESEPEPVDLEHDLPKGIKCKVNFELRRYFNKFQKTNAFNFSPISITFYVDQENIEEVENGDSEDIGD